MKTNDDGIVGIGTFTPFSTFWRSLFQDGDVFVELCSWSLKEFANMLYMLSYCHFYHYYNKYLKSHWSFLKSISAIPSLETFHEQGQGPKLELRRRWTQCDTGKKLVRGWKTLGTSVETLLPAVTLNLQPELQMFCWNQHTFINYNWL